LPYQEILNNTKMKSLPEVKAVFKKVNPENNPMVFSCGSGITACILAIGATLSGYKELAVYDGSWTEYGTLTNNETWKNSLYLLYFQTLKPENRFMPLLKTILLL